MVTTYDISLSSEAIKNAIMTLSTDIVWKNSAIANVYESELDPYESEIFIAANRGLLNFDIVRYIPREVLKNAGIHDSLIDSYYNNKNLIPTSQRDTVIREYTRALTSKHPVTNRYAYNVPTVFNGVTTNNYVEIYEEKNNYYRMLMGLPDIGDTNYVYNTRYTRYPLDIPIHEMTLADRLSIEESGYLDELMEQYPDKKYLKYIGTKSVDFFHSRVADRFDILWMNEASSDSTIREEYKMAYSRNKDVINKVYYTEAFKKSNDYYDNFLAMCIVFMTIQIICSKYLDKDITRDFYDTDSLKVVYDSYGVPFYSEIPLEYHKRIVKNINRLISYKGTTRVFLDLFDLFDLGTIQLYQYYMIKVHKLDPSGNPIFIYTTDKDGKQVLAEDQSDAYDIRFAKARVYEDISLQVSDVSNYVDYENIVSFDPYWVMDSDLEETINKEVFNYNETKYIGIQTVFDLMRITYENAYLIKMIYDNKDKTEFISVSVNGGTVTASLFDFFIYLGALYCKSKGWSGVISSQAATVSTYLGYDFKYNLTKLREKSYYDTHIGNDLTLLQYIRNMEVSTIQTIQTVFDNELDLRDYLVEKIAKCKTREDFFIYKDLYDTLMTSKYIDGIFGIYEGEDKSTTFEEVLSLTSATLYSRYMTYDPVDEIELVVNGLESQFTYMENLSYALDMDTNSLMDSLFKILNFFKSAKAELVGYDLVYLLTTRGIAYMKYLDKFVKISDNVSPRMDEYGMVDLQKRIIHATQTSDDLLQIANDEMVDRLFKKKIVDMIHYLTDELKILLFRYLSVYKEDITYTDTLDFSIEYDRSHLYSALGDRELIDALFTNNIYYESLKDSMGIKATVEWLALENIRYVEEGVSLADFLDMSKLVILQEFADLLSPTDLKRFEDIIYRSDRLFDKMVDKYRLNDKEQKEFILLNVKDTEVILYDTLEMSNKKKPLVDISFASISDALFEYVADSTDINKYLKVKI